MFTPRTSDISRSLNYPADAAGQVRANASRGGAPHSIGASLFDQRVINGRQNDDTEIWVQPNPTTEHLIHPFPTTKLSLITNERNPTKGDQSIAILRHKSDRTHSHTSVTYCSIGKSGIVPQQSNAIVINTQNNKKRRSCSAETLGSPKRLFESLRVNRTAVSRTSAPKGGLPVLPSPLYVTKGEFLARSACSLLYLFLASLPEVQGQFSPKVRANDSN